MSVLASPGLTNFVAGKQAVLAELIDTAAAARTSMDVDVFRAGGAFANELASSIADGVRTRAFVTNSRAALAEVRPIVDAGNGSGRVVPYGGKVKGHETFNHVKLVQADGERLTVSTAAMTMDDVDRIDWGMTVTGAPAAAAHRVARALESGGTKALRRALAEADAAGLHYNEPKAGTYHATAAWLRAIAGARPGTDIWIATKKITSVDAAHALIDASDAGVGVHLVVARPSDKVRGILAGSGVDARVTPWPGPSLHGNLTATADRVLLGTMYYSKRALGTSTAGSSRELLLAATDPTAVAQARSAIEAIHATATPL